VPQVRRWNETRPGDGRWLRKPLAGAAGQGIAFADEAAPRRSSRYFLQEFIDGTPMSAVLARARGATQLLGVTEQLIGEAWLHAPPFRYSGNIGPMPIAAALRHELTQIGTAIADRCALRGLFGIDFILRDGRPWVVEVNPRYTASIEVLELATGLRALAHHRVAFAAGVEAAAIRCSADRMIAKGILYASERIVMTPYKLIAEGRRLICAWNGRDFEVGTHLADLPAPGEVIETGWPVVTVLAAGASRESALRELNTRVRLIERMLHSARGVSAAPRDW
jgi:predicted ATP-grasp superfamily ATP-dependent carboligase